MFGYGYFLGLGTGSYNPIKEASPIAWYESDVGITTVSGAVSNWTSTTGSLPLFQNTVGSRPTYNAIDATFKNKPSIQSDGVDDNLATNAMYPSVYAQPNTFYIVCSGEATSGQIFGPDLGFTGKNVFYTYGDGMVELDCGADILSQSGIVPTNGTAYIACLVFNGTSSAIYINDFVTAARVGTLATDGFDNFKIFAGSTGTYPCAIKVAAIGSFNALHDAAARARIKSYLYAKYIL